MCLGLILASLIGIGAGAAIFIYLTRENKKQVVQN